MSDIRHDPAASADTDELRVERTVAIGAPVSLVWETLTSPAHMARWFGDAATFPDGVHAGATGSFGWDAHGEFPVRIDRFEPEREFAFTWGTPGEPIRADNATTATFTLRREGEATLVTVVETGFERLGDAGRARRALEDNRRGWTEELDDFVSLVVRRWAPAVRDDAAGAIVRSIELEAAPAEVWTALTDLAAIESWWGHPSRFPDGLRAGALGAFAWEGQWFPLRIERFTAPRTWQFRWGQLGQAEPGDDATTVRFDLTPSEGGTRLDVVESGWHRVDAQRRDAQMRDNVEGWNLVLDALRAYIGAR